MAVVYGGDLDFVGKQNVCIVEEYEILKTWLTINLAVPATKEPVIW